MRRKSERSKKTDKEKKSEVTVRKSKRQTRRRRKSSDSDSEENEEVEESQDSVDVPQNEESVDSAEKKPESHSNSDEEKPVWQVKQASDSSSGGEIQKLKICLQRPSPSTPEREKSPRKRKNTPLSETEEGSPEEKTSRTRRGSRTSAASQEDEEKTSRPKRGRKASSSVGQDEKLDEVIDEERPKRSQRSFSKKESIPEKNEDTEQENTTQQRSSEEKPVSETIEIVEVEKSVDTEKENRDEPKTTKKSPEKQDSNKVEDEKEKKSETEEPIKPDAVELPPEENEKEERKDSAEGPKEKSKESVQIEIVEVDEKEQDEVQPSPNIKIVVEEPSQDGSQSTSRRSSVDDKTEGAEQSKTKMECEEENSNQAASGDEKPSKQSSSEDEQKRKRSSSDKDSESEEENSKTKENKAKSSSPKPKAAKGDRIENGDSKKEDIEKNAPRPVVSTVKVVHSKIRTEVESEEKLEEGEIEDEKTSVDGVEVASSSEPVKNNVDAPKSNAIKEDEIKEEPLKLKPRSELKKRPWGNLKAEPKNPVLITTTQIIEMCPNVKLLSAEEVRLVRPEERKPVARPGLLARAQSSSDDTPAVNTMALNRKISIVSGDDAAKQQAPPSPAKHPKSNILFITNLVRPFTLKQLKELLQKTGNIVEDGFWTDRIKSKCYVQYETEEEAAATREALHGTQWPVGNGKKLSVDYGTAEDMETARNNVAPEPPVKPPPDLFVLEPKPPEPVEEKLRDKEEMWNRRQYPVREWDLGKGPHGKERSLSREREWDRDKERDRDWNKPDKERDRERERERERRDRHEKRRHTRSRSPTDRKKKREEIEEEPPAKMMDDLFNKTKALPCIYWLPLTPEEIAEKQKQRLIKLQEHERRLEEARRVQRETTGRDRDRDRIRDRDRDRDRRRR